MRGQPTQGAGRAASWGLLRVGWPRREACDGVPLVLLILGVWQVAPRDHALLCTASLVLSSGLADPRATARPGFRLPDAAGGGGDRRGFSPDAGPTTPSTTGRDTHPAGPSAGHASSSGRDKPLTFHHLIPREPSEGAVPGARRSGRAARGILHLPGLPRRHPRPDPQRARWRVHTGLLAHEGLARDMAGPGSRNEWARARGLGMAPRPWVG